MTSCTQEEAKPEAQTEAEALFELTEKGGDPDLVKVTVEFYAHVTEARKTEVRTMYERAGILKSYKKCSFVVNTEVWEMVCSSCDSDDDLPITTDPCPVETKSGERAPTTTDDDDDTDDSEECDIRKRTLGVHCDVL